jgi:hypothetical protein
LQPTYPLALQLISRGAVNVTDVIRSSLKAMVHTAHRSETGVTA